MQTASAVGIPSKTSWATTAVRRTDQGELYLVIAVRGSEQAPHVGRAFIRAVEEIPLTSAGEFYQVVLQQVQALQDKADVSLSLVFRQKQRVTLVSFGSAVIGLLRQGSARWLLDGSKPQQVLEGVIQAHDRLILATAGVGELRLPLGEWFEFSAEDISADLITRFHRSELSGELAALVLHETAAGGEQGVQATHSFNAPLNTVPVAEELETASESPPILNTPPRTLSSPLGSSAGESQSSQHLISPERLQAGILATKEEDQTKQWKDRWSTDWVARGVSGLRQLSWLKVILVLAVIGALVGGLIAWRTWRIQQERQAVIAPLEQLVQELQNYPEDQRLVQRDAARSLLERLQATRVNNRSNRVILQQLTQQVEQLYGSLSGEREVVNLPVFYDFRLVASDFLAIRADHFEEQAAFLDPNGQRIISLNLQTKSNQTVSNEVLSGGQDLAADNGRAYLLKPGSIESIPLSGASTSTLTELSLSEPSLIERFGENLYVFSRGSQQLWRFPSVIAEDDSEAASPSAWIRSAPGIDFSQVSSLSIDGSVWMGSHTGDIYKLSLGTRDEFRIEGLVEPFTSTLLVAAQPEGDRVAVVEPVSNRLVILNKQGVYQQQVSSEQIGGVTDIFWSEDERSVFLVAGSVVYKVDF